MVWRSGTIRRTYLQALAMSKEKFDLSNVGGQPKDWAQREHEKRLEPGLGFKLWAQIGLVVVCGLISLYGLGRLLIWLLR